MTTYISVNKKNTVYPNALYVLQLVQFEHNKTWNKANPLIYYMFDGEIICEPLEMFNSKFKVLRVSTTITK